MYVEAATNVASLTSSEPFPEDNFFLERPEPSLLDVLPTWRGGDACPDVGLSGAGEGVGEGLSFFVKLLEEGPEDARSGPLATKLLRKRPRVRLGCLHSASRPFSLSSSRQRTHLTSPEAIKGPPREQGDPSVLWAVKCLWRREGQ